MATMLADHRWCGPHGIGRFAGEVLRRLPALYPVPAPWPLLHPLEPVRLAWVLERLRPRVYLSPGFNPPLWSPVPCVFTLHDLIHLQCPAESSLTKLAYYRLVVRPAMRWAARVLTVSRYVKQELLAWAGVPDERVVVVGNGVGPPFGPVGPRHAPGYPYLFYAGNRKPHKNLPCLLQGYARSGLRGDVRLVLTGPPDAETHRQTAALGVTAWVVYAGQLPDTALAAYYRGAVALVCPALYEGFGLAPLEAMACGTPVLTSNVTALPEVVGEAALQVDPYDVEAIAWGMQRLVQDSPLRQALVRQGLERARLFTWEQTATRVWQVVQEATADHS